MIRITVNGQPATASQEQVNFIAREFVSRGGSPRHEGRDQVISLNAVQYARAIERFNDQFTASETSALMASAGRLANEAQAYLRQHRGLAEKQPSRTEAPSAHSTPAPKTNDFDVSGLSDENLRAADSLHWLDGEV